MKRNNKEEKFEEKYIILYSFEFECPYCGFSMESDHDKLWHYCPHCGKKVEAKILDKFIQEA